MSERLDIWLTKNNYFASRQAAQRAIQNGSVTVNGAVMQAKGAAVNEKDEVKVDKTNLPDSFKFVSRGGLKLEKAIKTFGIDFKDKTVLDVGASTGGFTDCALLYGADFVYALDVGHDQMAQKLKDDKRVTNIEHANFRDYSAKDFSKKIDIITVDVSFISLKLLVNNFKEVLQAGGELVMLIKPQFECGKEIADQNKGIILNPDTHKAVLEDVIRIFNKNGFKLENLDFSPITGTEGNIEYIAYFKVGADEGVDLDERIAKCVKSAFANFGSK